jgi:hypothetical protein
VQTGRPGLVAPQSSSAKCTRPPLAPVLTHSPQRCTRAFGPVLSAHPRQSVARHRERSGQSGSAGTGARGAHDTHVTHAARHSHVSLPTEGRGHLATLLPTSSRDPPTLTRLHQRCAHCHAQHTGPSKPCTPPPTLRLDWKLFTTWKASPGFTNATFMESDPRSTTMMWALA